MGDPDYVNGDYWLLNRSLYGLCRSPRHWYNMITGILRDMNLAPSRDDPCLFYGIINDDKRSRRRQSSRAAASAGVTVGSSTGTDVGGAADTSEPDRKKVYVGIYVDDFVFYSSDPAEEALFRAELSRRLNVDFMGDVDFFLGTAFNWRRPKNGHLSVYLC